MKLVPYWSCFPLFKLKVSLIKLKYLFCRCFLINFQILDNFTIFCTNYTVVSTELTCVASLLRTDSKINVTLYFGEGSPEQFYFSSKLSYLSCYSFKEAR